VAANGRNMLCFQLRISASRLCIAHAAHSQRFPNTNAVSYYQPCYLIISCHDKHALRSTYLSFAQSCAVL
jgi:hypothetical protein